MVLTDITVRNAKVSAQAYKLHDERGMYLRVTHAGGKLWRLKYRLNGKEKLMSLGQYPEIDLAEARVRRDHARDL